ncbi:LOW QUALITY PROTEIN: hypothetical protein Cgig2_015411 [Carnegiea gigantea]|uniref:Aminotransferase-like plant mobile domain-containing protein n=1 Tax=Carnegiea gigantea TaxID=171969 RepID=A0A9Q1QBP4_9CARY|nr:LOW QUALITY PROTEIN: hypothetical protein Cgig2_015411 [Carnegiea gigantea]
MAGTISFEVQRDQRSGRIPVWFENPARPNLNVIPSSTLASILVKKVIVKKGTLRYHRNNKNKYVDVSKDYKNCFNVTMLEKVNTGHYGKQRYLVEDEFYPILHRLITRRRSWGLTFQFHGYSTFMTRVIKWTKGVLIHFEEPLTLVYLVPLAYLNFHTTLTQMYGGPFMSIRIRGLPILGAMYKESFPLNKDTIDHNKYPIIAMNLFGSNSAWLYLSFLGEAANHLDHPSKGNTIFPNHYIIGWLVELFPYLDRHHPDSDCLGCLVADLHYARLDMFLGMVDIFLLGQLTSALRQQRSVMDLAQAYPVLQRQDIGVRVYVPPSYYEGGIDVIIGIISCCDSAKHLFASKARVSQSLNALCSIIIIYKLSTREIYWLSSKTVEIFGIVETVAHINDKGQHNNLPSEASKLILKEQKILKEKEWLHKMREDLTIQQQNLIEAESKLEPSLDLKKREVDK